MILDKKESFKIFYFATKIFILSIVFVFAYHLTIGITLTKLDKVTDVVVWFQERVENMDTFIAIKGFDKLILKTELSDNEKNKIRNNTKKLLNNLSPILDEVLLYKPVKKEN
jgi:hypothetical protein